VNGKELKDRLENLFSPREASPSLEALFSSFDFGGPSEIPQPGPVREAAPSPAREPARGKKKRKPGRPLFPSRARVTLSLEPGELRLLIARGQRVSSWASGTLAVEVLRGGEVVQPVAFGQAVAELVDKAGAPGRRLVVALSGQRSLVRILTLPAVPPGMLEEAVRREARRELPLPLEELYLSWQPVSETASSTRVFTIGIPREAVENCVAGLAAAGLRAVAMDLKPLALVRAVNRADVIVADLEQETGSVVLVRDFVPQITRSIALPGASEQSVAERAEHLAGEIERTLEFYGSTAGAGLASWSPAVCLAGALAEEDEVVSRIASQWSLVDPSPPIPLPPDLPVSRYLVNVGLAVKRLR
jgi:type IV pilus assembly protein PilM